MNNIIITKSITQPEEVINKFADDLGYQTVIPNPDYIPATFDSEQMVETAPAVGEPTIPNPQTRLEYVSEKFDDFVSEKFFGQFARRNAEQAAKATIDQAISDTKQAIKASIVTK